MSEESTILSSDVAVLKAQVTALQQEIGRLHEATSLGFASLGTRMDNIGAIVRDVTSLQERQVAQGGDMARSFRMIERLDADLGILRGAQAISEKRSERGIGVATGISLCFALLVSMVIYFASDVLEDTREHGQKIHEMELNEARWHGAPIRE